MSPTAAALAVLLHAATVLALWWVSPLNQRGVELNTENQAIDVTLERPQPEPPKPAPPAIPTPEPKAAPPPVAATPPPPPPSPPKATPVPLGLPPASPTTADTTKQAGSSTEQHRQAPDPQPQPATPAEPQKPSPDPQQATAAEKVPPPPPLERSLPPIDAPPPPTSKDIPKAPAPPPPPKAHAAPAAPTPPKQPLRPSPLSRPAPSKPNDAPAAAPSVTFVNPADQYEQSRLVEQYLTVVANKIAQYQYRSNQANEHGTVVLRMVIGRDGRLVDVSISKSSGFVNLDRGLIEAARAAAPFAPLPSGLPGQQIPFILPFAPVYNR